MLQADSITDIHKTLLTAELTNKIRSLLVIKLTLHIQMTMTLILTPVRIKIQAFNKCQKFPLKSHLLFIPVISFDLYFVLSLPAPLFPAKPAPTLHLADQHKGFPRAVLMTVSRRLQPSLFLAPFSVIFHPKISLYSRFQNKDDLSTPALASQPAANKEERGRKSERDGERGHGWFFFSSLELVVDELVWPFWTLAIVFAVDSLLFHYHSKTGVYTLNATRPGPLCKGNTFRLFFSFLS